MSLAKPPRLIEDPTWERSVLGPFVERARRTLARGAAVDPRPTWLRAYHRVPFYQQRFAAAALGLRDLHDRRALSAIPITRRTDLAGGVAPFLAHPLEPYALARGWLGRTSGSTGTPVEYLRDPRTLAWFWAFLDHVLAYVGARADARPVVMLDALEHMPEYDATLPLFHGVRFFKRRRVGDLDPQIVTGDPESLRTLLESRARPKVVLSSAFPLPAALRLELEQATGATVLEYYATQETSVIALGCRAGFGYHPVPGACHVEVVDGEVVATPVNNPSFVLIRYAPGDLATMTDEPCPCGLSGPRLSALLGRTDVRFRGVRGAFAAGLVGPLIARLPVFEHQLVQRSPDRYVLRYCGAPLDAAPAVSQRLRELAGCEITLDLERVDAIARTTAKPQPYVVEA